MKRKNSDGAKIYAGKDEYTIAARKRIKSLKLDDIFTKITELFMAHLNYKHFTLGVEEEYMVIDPETRELKSHEQKIVHEGQKMIKDKVKAEMHQAVVEVGTDICQDIDEAYKDVSTLTQNNFTHCR